MNIYSELMNNKSKLAVVGLGYVGMPIAVEFAKRMGACAAVNFMNHKGIEALEDAVKDAFGGYLADFAFQCTGSPVAHSNIYKFISFDNNNIFVFNVFKFSVNQGIYE